MKNETYTNESEFLYDFMKEMNKWEIRAFDLYKESNGGPVKNQETVRSELSDIYNKFLTQKDRKTGNLAGPSVSMMPEYDLLKEKIKEVIPESEKKTVILTEKIYPENNNYKEEYRYTIIKKSSRLFLDKKEKYSSVKEKWINIVF